MPGAPGLFSTQGIYIYLYMASPEANKIKNTLPTGSGPKSSQNHPTAKTIGEAEGEAPPLTADPFIQERPII
jgi:hypothetical protein